MSCKFILPDIYTLRIPEEIPKTMPTPFDFPWISTSPVAAQHRDNVPPLAWSHDFVVLYRRHLDFLSLAKSKMIS